MNKKVLSTVICLLLVLATVFSFSGCNEIVERNYGDDLIVNGSFDDNLNNWEKVTSYANSDNITIEKRSVGVDAYEQFGAGYVSLHNANSGYSYIRQTVDVEPGAVYKVTAHIFIGTTVSVGTDESYEGAFIGFEENVDFIPLTSKKTTSSEWGNKTAYSFYVTTDYRQVTITANLGTESANCKGEARFDEIQMIKVDPASLPQSAKLHTLTEYIPQNGGTYGVLFVVLGALAVLLVAYFIYVAFRRCGYVNEDESDSKLSSIVRFMKKGWAIYVLLGVALVVRVLVGIMYGAYSTELGKIGDILTAHGLNGYYANSSYEVLPVYLYIEWAMAGLGNLFGAYGIGAYFLMKLPAIICDLVTVWFIYKLGKKFIGTVGGYLAGLMYAIIPTVLTVSSVWVSVDSVFAMLAVMIFYFILNPNELSSAKRFTGIYICLVAGVLTKIEMLWFVGIISAFLIYNFIKKPELRKSILIGGISSILAFYVVTIPFCIDYIGEGRVFYIWEVFYKYIALGTHYYTSNAFGLYALVGLNNRPVTAESQMMNYIFAILLIAFTLLIYFKSKSRVDIMLLASFTLLGAFTFAIDMTPTVMLAGIALLIAYAVVTNEKRAYILATVYALLGFLNCATLLSTSGALIPFYLNSDMASYVAGSAFLIIASIAQIIAFVYFVYLIYDICVNDKLKQFDFIEGYDTATVWGKIVSKFKR